jgi:hypothetical protein
MGRQKSKRGRSFRQILTILSGSIDLREDKSPEDEERCGST